MHRVPYWISIPAIWPYIIIYLMAIWEDSVNPYFVLAFIIPFTYIGIIISAYTVQKYYNKRWI